MRLLRFQLPKGFVPAIPGVEVSLCDQTSDNRDDALIGQAPGDFGFRFDWYEYNDDGTIELVMCLLQYADTKITFGGLSITYHVRRVGNEWVAELYMMRS